MKPWRVPFRLCLIASWGAPTVAWAVPTGPGELINPLVPADTCRECHSFDNLRIDQSDPLYAPAMGWTGSLMANAARDPVFWGAVAIAHQDAPDETETCIRCHSPRAFLEGRGNAIAMDELTPEDRAGVECELCHRTVEDAGVQPGNAQYTLDDGLVGETVPRRGPWSYDAAPGAPPHSWIQDAYVGTSRLCGTCHDVTTSRERVDDRGASLGVNFNEQRTYSEWLNSAYATEDSRTRTCQDCHMPAVADVPGCNDNANAGTVHATGGRRHDLAGANLFMLSILRGAYGSAGTGEVDDFYYDRATLHTEALLETAASLQVAAPASVDAAEGLSNLAVTVTNLTGHKLPTGYSEGRMMWIEVTARYGEDVLWSSGLWQPGRPLQEDAQLRSYHAVAEDFADGTQLHLLRNNHWVEDSRIPPLGLTPDLETDPVGGRYALQDDGTWPNFDVVSYAFPGVQNVVDKTPDVADDDQLSLDVRLLYLINSPSYIEFLADTNRTNDAGTRAFELFDQAGGAPPIVLAEQHLELPLTGLTIAEGTTTATTSGATSSTTSAVDSSQSGDEASATTATTVSLETTSATTNPDTGTPPDETSGSDGCGCTSMRAPFSPWLVLVLPGLIRRRRRARLA